MILPYAVRYVAAFEEFRLYSSSGVICRYPHTVFSSTPRCLGLSFVGFRDLDVARYHVKTWGGCWNTGDHRMRKFEGEGVISITIIITIIIMVIITIITIIIITIIIIMVIITIITILVC